MYEQIFDLKEDGDLKEKIKELTRQRDIFLSIFFSIATRCKEHDIGIMNTLPDSVEREVVDFGFQFNIHTFIIYCIENVDFIGNIKSGGNENDFVKKWNDFLAEKLMPVFIKEVENIKKEFEEKFKKEESVDYIR